MRSSRLALRLDMVSGARFWLIMVITRGVITGGVISMLAGHAHAQHYSLHGQAGAAVAWTDNVSNDPSSPLEGESSPQSAFYTQLRPAALFTFETPRTVHVTSLGIDLSLYAAEDPPPAYSGTAAHNSLFTTSQSTELGLGAALSTGRISAVLGEAGGELQQATPRGGSTFYGVNGNQAFRWQLNRRWRLSQGLSAAQVETDVETTTGTLQATTLSRTAGVTFGLDRAWTRTSAGITGGVSLISIGQTPAVNPDCLVDPMDPTVGECTSTRQRNYALTANVRRDIGPRWSASAQAGISALDVYEAVDPLAEVVTVIPSGGVTVNYFRPLGSVTMAVGGTINRNIVPNLILGTTTTSTGGVLTSAIPLPWLRQNGRPSIRFSTTVGYARSEVIDGRTSGDDIPSWAVYTGDVAAVWTPRDALDVSLRGQYVSTSLDDRFRIPDPNDGIPDDIPVPTPFARTTILVQVSGRFPTRQAAVMPDRRQMRVDRANETPEGEDGQSPGGAGGGSNP